MSSPPPADPPSGPVLAFDDDDDEELSERRRESLAAFLRKLSGRGAPTRLGAYELERAVGSGGFGQVWRARHLRTGARAVVKFMPASNPGAEAAADAEVRALAAVRHPHIVEILDRGCESGFHWIAMQCVDGETLKERLERRLAKGETVAPPDEAARIMTWMRDAALALHAMHGQGRVHRDLKPANLMIDEAGRIRLIDLGLAIGEDGGLSPEFAGTAAYMSPEQTHPRETLLGPPSDVYSLAVTMHEALTGVRVVRERTRDLALHAVATVPVPPPSRVAPGLPRTLDPLFRRALAKHVADRYATAAELAEDVGRWLEGKAPCFARESIGDRLLRRRLLAATCVLIVVAAAFTVPAWLKHRRMSAAISAMRAAAAEGRHAQALAALDVVRSEFGLHKDVRDAGRDVLDVSVDYWHDRVSDALTSSWIGSGQGAYARVDDLLRSWEEDYGVRQQRLSELRALAAILDERCDDALRMLGSSGDDAPLGAKRLLTLLASTQVAGSTDSRGVEPALWPLDDNEAAKLGRFQLCLAVLLREFLADADPASFRELFDDAAARTLAATLARETIGGAGGEGFAASVLAAHRRLSGASREAFGDYLQVASACRFPADRISARGYAAICAAFASAERSLAGDGPAEAALTADCFEEVRFVVRQAGPSAPGVLEELLQRACADLWVHVGLRPREAPRTHALAVLLAAGRASAEPETKSANAAARKLRLTDFQANGDLVAGLPPVDRDALAALFDYATGWRSPADADSEELFRFHRGALTVAGAFADGVAQASDAASALRHYDSAMNAMRRCREALGDRRPDRRQEASVTALAEAGMAAAASRAGAADARDWARRARSSAARALEAEPVSPNPAGGADSDVSQLVVAFESKYETLAKDVLKYLDNLGL